jgi:deazaflavin-dependent oxidoreductase (nitroreductase family)
MPFPKYLAIINKHVTNRFFLLFAGWIPPFAIVEHRGRRSGKLYRTPILAFPTTDGFVFALTYGRDVDWVKNLFANNFGFLRYNGAKNPIHAFSFSSYIEMKEAFPFLVRFFLNIISVDDCLLVVKQKIE